MEIIPKLPTTNILNCCDQVKEFCNCDNCSCTLECMKKWTKVVLIGASCTLVILGIGRFFNPFEMFNPFNNVIEYTK